MIRQLPRCLMVVGTGARSGKTAIAAGIIRVLNTLELPAVGLKPIETGCSYGEDHDLIGADGAVLRAAARVQIPPLVASPYRFASALPPALAVEAAGLELELADLVSAAEATQSAGLGSVVIEGPGGPLTPLATDGTTLDFAKRLPADIVLVGPSRPGVESDLMLAVEAAEHRSLTVKGILLTHIHADTQAVGVVEVLKRYTDVPVFPPISHGSEPIDTVEAHLVEHRIVESFLNESAPS